MDNRATKDRTPAGNSGLAKWRVTCFYETFVQGSTAVILLKFCTKIRHIAKPKTVVRKQLDTLNKFERN
jgi:hypothetical protein